MNVSCPCRWFPVLGFGEWVGHEFFPCDHGTNYPIDVRKDTERE